MAGQGTWTDRGPGVDAFCRSRVASTETPSVGPVARLLLFGPPEALSLHDLAIGAARASCVAALHVRTPPFLVLPCSAQCWLLWPLLGSSSLRRQP